MEQKTLFYLQIIVSVLIFILLIGLYFHNKSEGGQCLINPISYGLEKLSAQTVPRSDFSCSCSNPGNYKLSFIADPKNVTWYKEETFSYP